MAFIDEHRSRFGVEPICRVLRVAPSAWWRRAACRRDPSQRSARQIRDEALAIEIRRVWQESFQVYGADKIWHQLRREGITVARCTVERLMRKLGIAAAVRGKTVCTTISDASAPCLRDRGNRQFNRLLKYSPPPR